MRSFIMVALFMALMAFVPAQTADSLFVWNVDVTAYSGEETHWVSPEPVPVYYARYYASVDADVQVEMLVLGVWINVGNERRKGHGEATGPIPPGGRVVYAQRLSFSGKRITTEADVNVWLSSDGWLHADVTHFTSSVPIRITLKKPAKILATNTVYGDLNGNGILDFNDVFLYADCITDTLVQLDVPTHIADLDNDGIISFQDLMLVCEFIGNDLPSAYTNW